MDEMFLRTKAKAQVVDVVLTTRDDDLLGYAKLDDMGVHLRLLEVVARPGLGNVLFNAMAMYAYVHDKWLAPTTIDDHISDKTSVQWLRLYSHHQVEKTHLSPVRGDHIGFGYKMPPSAFYRKCVEIGTVRLAQINKHIKMGEDWFYESYSAGNDSSWIDEVDPLTRKNMVRRLA